ncbi:alpha/beta hydrolase [Arachidicoccus terrestris]|uniref:alpha/beta hydrolase n=1 Tax=Arachidicoccus terrestris TaxID=2875539 RepID=UPI001CC5E992|nr:alpha/beta hydrolase [Arachidicoccus terrestris]UAY55652.1 alpha/beta hydrolase [Arachidicoccus terrestris]
MNPIKSSIVLLLICIGMAVQAQTKKTDYLTTDDSTRLFVKKSGKGPICIFIHGGPGAWSKSFEELKGRNLETNLSMVYYDQRGCGRSQKAASGDYSLERMIKDIDLIRKHYGAEKVYLMSHSFGGILALNYSLRHPDHVKGLILVNSTLSMGNSLENQLHYINSLLNTDFAVPDSTSASLLSTFLTAKKALSEKDLGYKMLSDNKTNVGLVDEIDRNNPSDYDFAKHVFSITDYWQDYTPMTAQVNLPVLIVTGAKDHSIGENHYLLFHFKNGAVRKINGGHILYYENNKAFISSVFDFVKTN